MKSRLVLLACCLALLSSCGQGDKGTGKAPEFAVIEAKTTTANLTNSYPATIKGKQDVEIRPMVSGFITKLHVDEGATVHKGQVLFSIDPVQYQAAVNSAKAAVETAKAESLVIEDGCSLGTADTWNEVAQLALKIEHIQCWFDAFEDDHFKKEAD